MATGRVNSNWRLELAYPILSRLPSRFPWHVAKWVGREDAQSSRQTQSGLRNLFGNIFPDATETECQQWALRHVNMLTWEMVDGLAFPRMGAIGGPRIHMKGIEHAQELSSAGRGFILVLNHYDRLLTAPVALARHGIFSNVLTMPVVDNPDLSDTQRQYLLKKINGYRSAVRGEWRTTSQSLRPVHESLRAGKVWVILADAWRPEFERLKTHPFLNGQLSLPTGIERLAQSTGVPMLHGRTFTQSPGLLDVQIDRLPEEPALAISTVIQQLEQDVRRSPWAWWQWGQWESMWQPPGNVS